MKKNCVNRILSMVLLVLGLAMSSNAFADGWTAVTSITSGNQYYLSNGTYYVKLSGTTLSVTSDPSEATLWTFATSGNGYTITSGGKYLRLDSSYSLIVSSATNRGTWGLTSNGYLQNKSKTSYYISVTSSGVSATGSTSATAYPVGTYTFPSVPFKLKTSGTINTSKKYLFVCQETANDGSNVLMNSSNTTNANNGNRGAGATEVSIANNFINTPVTNAFTFEKVTGTDYYYIKNNAGYYIGAYSSSDDATSYFEVTQSKSSSYYNTLSYADGGNIEIVSASGNTLQYDHNTGNNTLNFIYGGWNTFNGKVYLYEQFTGYNVTVNQATGGTISATSSTGSLTSLNGGETITLSETTNDGYTFGGYTVKDESGNDVTVTNGTFTMPASDVTVTATFTEKTKYTITCESTTGGTVSADAEKAYEGKTVTLTVNTEAGYEFGTLTVNGADVTSSVADGKYTFTMPASNVTVSATFTALPTYAITCKSTTGGTVTASPTSTYQGATVTLTVTPTDGYVLNTLVATGANGETITITNKTFTMPASAVTVIASFKATTSSTTKTYVLKTSGTIDTSKKYIIVNQAGQDATSGTIMNSTFTVNYVTVNDEDVLGASGDDITIDADTKSITASDDYAFTISKSTVDDSYYTILNSASTQYYIGSCYTESTDEAEINKKWFDISTTVDEDHQNSITFAADGHAIIVGNWGIQKPDATFCLQFDKNDDSNNQELFFYGADNTESGEIYLYEEVPVRYELTSDSKNVTVYGPTVTESVITGAHTYLNDINTDNSLVYLDNASYSGTKTNVITKDSDGDFNCASLVITDKIPLSVPTAFSASTVTYTRANSKTWGTVCVPYALTSGNGIQYYELDDVSETEMTFSAITSVAANQPAVFCLSASGDVDWSKASTTSVSATMSNDVTKDDITLVGVQTEAVTLPVGSSNYYIANNKFWRPTTNAVNVAPQRAYFKVTGTQAKAASLSINVNEEEADAIDALFGNNEEVTVVGYYNINGTQQDGLHKGINIVKFSNGVSKKIIIK